MASPAEAVEVALAGSVKAHTNILKLSFYLKSHHFQFLLNLRMQQTDKGLGREVVIIAHSLSHQCSGAVYVLKGDIRA